MGNSFGYIPEGGWNLKFHPEITPDPSKDSTVDSNLGFEGERKKRVMIATEEEMISAKIPLKDRDYCAHLLIKYQTCCTRNWPWAVNCEHEKHEYSHCVYEDYLIRMKEYERERRLMVKEQNNRSSG